MSTAARRRLMRDFKVHRQCKHSKLWMLAKYVQQSTQLTASTAHANRPACWRLCFSSCRQCHDLVRFTASTPHATSSMVDMKPLPCLEQIAAACIRILNFKTDIYTGMQSSSAPLTRRSKMEPSALSCISKKRIPTSRRVSSLSARCFTPTYTERASCVWTFSKTDGRPRTMSRPS